MATIAPVGTRPVSARRPYIWILRHRAAMAVLVLADALAFATGYYLFRHHQEMPAFILSSSPYGPNLASATDIYLIMGGAFVITRYIFGDYGRRQLFWDGARTTTSALPLFAIPDILLVVLLGKTSLYLPLALSWLFLFPAIPFYRQTARRLMSMMGLWQIPTALIGTGRNASDAYAGLRGELSLGFDVRYLIVMTDEAEIPDALKDLQCIRPTSADDVLEKLNDLDCHQVIVATDDAQGAQTSDIIQHLIGSNIEIAIIPFLHGLPLFGLSTNYLFGKDVLLMQLRNNLARIPSRAVKGLVDFIGPILLWILFLPLFLVIVIAIKRDDGGPVFYSQQRIGRGGKTFRCLKFRTMAVNANERLEQWRQENPALYAEYMRTFKLRDDPRVTRVGKWLRRTSLDELPQLWNVLRGEMSLVGPRPVVLQELVEFYGPAAQLYKRVRPGLTGLWQISGRSETSYADRISYDEWYILNWSLWYDLVILIHTARIVLSGRGAF
jgi:undecaprenyl-phosphate galactose phosphotransferase